MKYWLMKSEPETFSFDDLLKSPKQTTHWNGVRNYQARNFMRDDFKKGDLVLFYHSNAEVPGVYGIAEVVREGYPEEDVWFMVDIKAKQKLKRPVSSPMIAEHPKCKEMMVMKKGSRLSIQPVTKPEFDAILEMGS